VKVELIWQDGVLKPIAGSDSRMAVKSVETQILHMVRSAWDSGRPYKGRKGFEGFLDAEMVAAFAGRVEMGVIVTALKNLKEREIIVVDRVGDRRGYRVSVDGTQEASA
jgi:DNA-binding PadR family transcriptional regulator